MTEGKQLISVKRGIACIVIGALVALGIGVWQDKTGDDDNGSDSGSSTVELLDVPELIIANAAATLSGKICDPRYDYPGCTLEQQRSAEAGTRDEMGRHWELRRWGQSHDQWAGLRDNLNDRLRRQYNDAIRRLVTAPFAGSWKEYKDKTDCIGAFRANPAAGWCQINQSINDLFDPLDHFVLHCGGKVLGGAVGGGIAAAKNVYAVPVGALLGGAGGSAQCVIDDMWDDIHGANKAKAMAR